MAPVICLSQNWGIANSVWYYNQMDYGPPFNQNYIKFTSVGDTVILGDTVKIIKEEFMSFDHSSSRYNYMKSDSNRVYLLVPTKNKFELLYDFDALPGDTFRVYCRDALQDSTILVKVDSVSDRIINGKSLKVQYVTSELLEGEEFQMYGEIIENIGWVGFMFPLHALMDPPYGGSLRCFENDSIGQFKYLTIECDYINALSNIENITASLISPNPTDGLININVETLKWVEIFGMSGECIYHGSDDPIDLSCYPKGTYIVKAYTLSKIVTDKVILK